MSAQQSNLFIGNEPYIYQQNSTGISVAMGIDTSGQFSLSASTTPGASPSPSSQFVVDPTANETIISSNTISLLGTVQFSLLATAGVIVNDSSGNLSSEAYLTIAQGGTNTATTPGTNAVMYFDGTKYVGLTNGTTGQILTATTSSAPSWGAAGGGGIPSIAGTANQINEAGSPGATTLSLSSTAIMPGSLSVTSGFTVSAGTITLTPLNAAGMVINDASGILTSHQTTNHALQLGNSSGQLNDLSVGATGVILQGNTSADPSWSTATYPSTAATGSVLYASGTNTIAALAAGTNGYVLTMGASVPAWSAASGGGLTWNDQASGSVTMAVNNGYIIDNGASLVTATLPATAAQGSIFEIAGKSSGGWKVGQAASQVINFGSTASTSGTGGSIASTNQYDCVRILCVTANTTFVVLSSVGNLTVV